MKSLTIHTLVVAVALALRTPSLAVSGELSPVPVSPAEHSDRHSATAAISAAPLHALTRLDAETLAEQAMTDQELKAVEGGRYYEYDHHYDLMSGRSYSGFAGASASATGGN